MNCIKSAIIIISLALLCQSCSNNMTIVKTHQKQSSNNSFVTDSPWQSAYNSGLAHYNKREYDKALEFFNLALKGVGDDDETRAWMYFSIGRCWEGLKETAKAEQNFIMAQNLDPNLTEASDGLARIAKRRADKD